MVGQIYPAELQVNKANSSDTEAPFLNLILSITNDIVSSKIYDQQDDFNFEIVVVVFVFNVPPTAKVIWRWGHGLKSHPTDW